MKNYFYYLRTILFKFFFNLIPIKYIYAVIDIIALKESKDLISGSTQISNNFKWDKKKIRFDCFIKKQGDRKTLIMALSNSHKHI